MFEAFWSFMCSVAVCAPPPDPLAGAWRIAQPGLYRLEEDRVSRGMFNIKIEVPDVEIDLNGKTLRCAPDDPKRAVTFGIHAAELHNVRIRNGRITGCHTGLHASYSRDVTVENVDFSDNTYIGVTLGGPDNVVRNSLFLGITGYAGEAYAVGINNPGPRALIENNTFLEIYRQDGAPAAERGEGVGIIVRDSAGVQIRRNTFINRTDSSDIAIWVKNSNAFVAENTIVGFGFGIASRNAEVTAIGNLFKLHQPLAGSVAIGDVVDVERNNIFLGYQTAVENKPNPNVVR